LTLLPGYLDSLFSLVTKNKNTPENPTKDRLLAESYLDGVYVENVEAFCKNIKPKESTVIGGIVRSLSELPQDLIRWGDETSRFIYVKKGLENFY